ncbi:hypothetical protein [Roseimicrobium sp. ORNL1]|uniref:hypothetical protein n=1 Tax=Roseimicrobium sp. ORNL1 TaxID=2711231 RepID=UPI0013E132F9|nr:hypothetical protein [Roseimicrobium sp. ORNL1]QIF05080.1 hypothetical protein G5S37_27395 [Roseimicrobium sp. ORNL1]
MVLLLLVVALHPATASANAGTPLMWATMWHLVFGNLFIGLAEGWLLSWAFGTRRGASMLVMILANYLSAWLGVGILGNFRAPDPLSLPSAVQWLCIMVGSTYVVTLALEWPFVAWMFRGRPQWFGKSIRASLLVQTFSYVLLFAYYGSAGHLSLYTRTERVDAKAFTLPEQVMVYYISCDDGDIYRRPLSHGEPIKVMELNSTSEQDHLFIRNNNERPAEWDLVARLEHSPTNPPEFVTVASNIKSGVAPGLKARAAGAPLDGSIWDSVGEIDRLGDGAPSPWTFRTGYWPAAGLSGSNKETGKRWRLAFETPFISLAVRNAVQLPGDKVLFQLGWEEIYVLDPATLQLALLWRGRSPVATLGIVEGTSSTAVTGPASVNTASPR